MTKDESNKRCMLRADSAAADGIGRRAHVPTKERRAEENCAEERRVFSDDCRVANMRREYPGYEGDIRWMIFTDLSEEELADRYGEEIASYQPFILLTMEMYKAFRTYRSNERKFEIRMAKSGHAECYEDDVFEARHPGMTDEWEAEVMDRIAEYAPLYDAIDQLSEMQRRRIIRHYFDRATMAEIAREEGVDPSAISYSIKKSLAILKEILQNHS